MIGLLLNSGLDLNQKDDKGNAAINLALFKFENIIVSLALNKAKGDVIIRVDGHCEIQQNYIEKCYNLLKETDADIVGGVIETISSGFVFFLLHVISDT